MPPVGGKARLAGFLASRWVHNRCHLFRRQVDHHDVARLIREDSPIIREPGHSTLAADTSDAGFLVGLSIDVVHNQLTGLSSHPDEAASVVRPRGGREDLAACANSRYCDGTPDTRAGWLE